MGGMYLECVGVCRIACVSDEYYMYVTVDTTENVLFFCDFFKRLLSLTGQINRRLTPSLEFGWLLKIHILPN